MNVVYPAAFMLNGLAMTALLIILGMAGRSDLAADVGIVQGATLALFYLFSGNARSILLSADGRSADRVIVLTRVALIVPLGLTALWMSVAITDVGFEIAAALVFRRMGEWIGELTLSMAEREGWHRFAIGFLGAQALALVACVAWILGDVGPTWAGIAVWALIPWLSAPPIVRCLREGSVDSPRGAWRWLLPQFGSSAVTGITVYVFRLLLLLLVGKQMAGSLYAAFAVGGVLGTTFASTIGPSIALHESRTGRHYFPMVLRLGVAGFVVGGMALLGAVVFAPELLQRTGTSLVFWEAVGWSMLGGVAMLYAQRIRFRVLQHHARRDLFGPDLLLNIVIIATIPYAYALFGMRALPLLFLVSGVAALLFYGSAAKTFGPLSDLPVPQLDRLKTLIAIGLLLPVFVQIGHGIFRDPAMVYDSGGRLVQLPIPISVVVCFAGIVLIGGYQRAYHALGVIFLTFLLMLMAAMMSSHGSGALQQDKLVLLLQFVLPMFGLVLGQTFGARGAIDTSLQCGFLWVVGIIVPLQILVSWWQGYAILSPYLYLFSTYQHFQYTSTVLVSAYIVALFGLWGRPGYRSTLMALGAAMAIYAVASMSVVAMALLVMGVLVLAIRSSVDTRDGRVWLLGLIVVATGVAYSVYRDAHHRNFDPPETGRFNVAAVLPNAMERTQIWSHYWKGITSNPTSLAFGQAHRPDRIEMPSAHNYFLDFAYNFGTIAFLPLLGALVYTIIIIVRRRAMVWGSPALLGLVTVVVALLLVDNALKVGLRQPYPGIYTFFLWGVLLSSLRREVDRGAGNESP